MQTAAAKLPQDARTHLGFLAGRRDAEERAAVSSTPLVLGDHVVFAFSDDASHANLEIREAAPLLQIAIRDCFRTDERLRRDVDGAHAILGHSGEQSSQVLRAFLPDMLAYDFAPRISQRRSRCAHAFVLMADGLCSIIDPHDTSEHRSTTWIVDIWAPTTSKTSCRWRKRVCRAPYSNTWK